MMDWFIGVDLRQWVDLSFYDRTIENPVQVGKEVLQGEVDQVVAFNEQLKKTGDQLDERFGIKQGEGGVWGGEYSQEETPKPQVSQSKPQSSQRGTSVQLGYDQVGSYLESSTLSNNDKYLIQALSPLNTGTFEGEQITVHNTNEEITITAKEV